jgi:hypothetical protein
VVSVALSAVGGECGPDHPDSGFKGVASTTQWAAKLIDETEEDVLPATTRFEIRDRYARLVRPTR